MQSGNPARPTRLDASRCPCRLPFAATTYANSLWGRVAKTQRSRATVTHAQLWRSRRKNFRRPQLAIFGDRRTRCRLFARDSRFAEIAAKAVTFEQSVQS